jgi:hypothetical protein
MEAVQFAELDGFRSTLRRILDRVVQRWSFKFMNEWQDSSMLKGCSFNNPLPFANPKPPVLPQSAMSLLGCLSGSNHEIKEAVSKQWLGLQIARKMSGM